MSRTEIAFWSLRDTNCNFGKDEAKGRYQHRHWDAHIFGNMLSPDIFSARGNLTSELLRFL